MKEGRAELFHLEVSADRRLIVVRQGAAGAIGMPALAASPATRKGARF
jgi:hypothetical protein